MREKIMNELKAKGYDVEARDVVKNGVCKKGIMHLDRKNHKDRLYKPLLKKDGKWHEISFEDTEEIVAENKKKYDALYEELRNFKYKYELITKCCSDYLRDYKKSTINFFINKGI